MNPEIKRFKYMLAAGIAGVSSLFLAACHQESQPMCIGQYPVRDLSTKLHAAQDALKYEPEETGIISTGKGIIPVIHPAQYPDGRKARKNIQEVINQTPDFDIQDQLKKVLTSIPDEAEIRTVQGQSVTSAFFIKQMNQLDGVTSYAKSIQRPCGVGVKVSQN